jgi:hypothetical protein
MPWTRAFAISRYFKESTRECFVHVEALMNALERALKRGDQAATAAARAAIKQSALAIEVLNTEYRIQLLQPVFDAAMSKIGAQNLANAPLGITGQLDTWGMPINAYIYMGDDLVMPWDGIVVSRAWSPWNRRRERKERKRAASVAHAYASLFQPEFIEKQSGARPGGRVPGM